MKLAMGRCDEFYVQSPSGAKASYIKVSDKDPAFEFKMWDRPVVTVYRDGAVTFGEGFTPETAALAFWSEVGAQAARWYKLAAESDEFTVS